MCVRGLHMEVEVRVGCEQVACEYNNDTTLQGRHRGFTRCASPSGVPCCGGVDPEVGVVRDPADPSP
jgi:hypothetical protein